MLNSEIQKLKYPSEGSDLFTFYMKVHFFFRYVIQFCSQFFIH